MADKETLAVYATRAEDYAKRFGKADVGPHMSAFLDKLPKGGRILDLGCGPAHSSLAMIKEGYEVEAWDASPDMARVAKSNHGVDVSVASFDDLTTTADYDGIYANFSLLHAAKADMPRHLASIARALKTGGWLHIGLKTGHGEKRDALGRFYAYYTEAELEELLIDEGLTPAYRKTGEEVGLDGTAAPWIILHARKDD